MGQNASDLTEAGNSVDVALPDDPAVTLRPMLMERALRIIIENACRYGERARAQVTQGAGDVHIPVWDDGPGIPEHMHEAVFDPFVRLEVTRARETGGTGLGLSIARTIDNTQEGARSCSPTRRPVACAYRSSCPYLRNNKAEPAAFSLRFTA